MQKHNLWRKRSILTLVFPFLLLQIKTTSNHRYAKIYLLHILRKVNLYIFGIWTLEQDKRSFHYQVLPYLFEKWTRNQCFLSGHNRIKDIVWDYMIFNGQLGFIWDKSPLRVKFSYRRGTLYQMEHIFRKMTINWLWRWGLRK